MKVGELKIKEVEVILWSDGDLVIQDIYGENFLVVGAHKLLEGIQKLLEGAEA